ncbi:hypothetical protein TWF694_009703 [Orbilia ellipsospora]|uniref:RING-type E3 ubiquitin transferase n=1 Tax=Orbilia ellipsospora TaxID=2528407 RepID=A0AAV9XBL9_9PEZI
MAMTEPPAHQQPYNTITTTASNDLDIDPVVASHVVVASPSSPSAGPSSSATPLIPAVDDLKIAAAAKLDVPAPSRSPVCSASSQNGPTPPSSPSQRGAPAEQAITVVTGSSNTHSDRPTTSSSASSSSRPQRLQQQQPTPPSTLPEDAAFPQAAADHSNMQDFSSSSLPPSPSNQPREPYTIEHEPLPPDTTSMSSPSSSSSGSLSTLDDGVPTLDANEATFLIRSMDADGDTVIASLPAPPSHSNNSSRSNLPQDGRPTTLPRIPSSSSQHSTVAELPNLQIPQHSPPVPFQPHQTGSQYSFPYVSTLDSRLTSSTRPERDNRPPLSPELPPWQPDSEVSHCPICSTGFSFFYRKHHCRKCGRVVCAPCSPHRIVIPKSYVVYPPNAIDVDLASESYVDAAGNRRGSYGGDTGVEVRICNTCLMGGPPSSSSQAANQARRQSIQSPPGGAGRFWQDAGPPTGVNVNSYAHGQNAGYGGNSNHHRRRTVSTSGHFTQSHAPGIAYSGGQAYPGVSYHHHHSGQQAHSLGSHHGPFQPHPPYHSHPEESQRLLPALPLTLRHPTPSYPLPNSGHSNFSFAPAQFYPSPQPPHYHTQQANHQRSVSASSSHQYNHYSPVNQPISGLLDTSQRPVPAFSMPDTSRPNLPIASQFMQGNSSSSRELQTHSAPPPSFPRLKETDYCPICQNVLPPPDPVTKDETAREAHIQSCIDNTISGHSASRRRSTSGTPTNLAQTTMTSQPSTSQPSLQPLVAAPLPRAHSSEPARRSRASSRPTGGRMVVYTATAKDTLPSGNDAKADDEKAECVICFEEFEEGDQIARLECFCRYHKKCITDWFNRRGDGQCPVHAMNE